MICSPWITADELVDCNCPDASEAVVTEAIAVASDILYRLSGQVYPGICAETVRPCLCGACAGWSPSLIDGTWFNSSCSHSDPYCGCGGRAVRLPRDRVTDVTQVLIDGAIFISYRLDSPGWLVRTDGGVWPSRQDIHQETTEKGTWSVSYSFGRLPPAGGLFAAKWLTAEIIKACTGGKCRLPAHAVSVSRRGVSYDLEAMKGRVGIPEADMWLSTVNPNGRSRPARITAADDPRFVAVDSGS